MVQNPFNGIERLELKVHRVYELEDHQNPFNGIESGST